MKELNIPFQEIFHPFGHDTDWNDYSKINPSGLVPCLIDKNQIVWDSLAIVEYLAERHTDVWPKNNHARSWARCASSEMHSGFFSLRNICSMSCGVRVELKEISPSLKIDISRIDELWHDGLNRFNGPFLAGKKFTAVDAFFAPVVFRFQTYGIQLSIDSQKYMEKLLSLDSMKLWYEEALNELYRDTEHESEISANGKITVDLRRTQ